MFDDIDFGNEELKTKVADAAQKAIAEAVAQATGDLTGLKTTNAALKQEKKELSEQAKKLQSLLEGVGGEEGLTTLQKMAKQLEQDELGKLLAEGKTTEFIQATTQNAEKQYADQIAKQQEQIAELQATAKSFQERFFGTRVTDVVTKAAIEAGVHKSAIPDVVRRASEHFKYQEDGDQVVMLDPNGGVVFGKDAKSPKSPTEWLEEIRPDNPHLWPANEAGGAAGSGRASSGSHVISQADARDPAKYATAKEAAQKAGAQLQIAE